MEESYYACWFRLDKVDQYLIWVCSDPDSVLLDDHSHILVFKSESDLAQYASSWNVMIMNEEPVLHDLDATQSWLEDIYSHLDCHTILSAWNLFLDVSYAVGVPYKGDRDYYKTPSRMRNRVYDKLFYGNNVYKLTPDGEYYIPVWTAPERKKIAEIIAHGLAIFRQHSTPIKVSTD